MKVLLVTKPLSPPWTDAGKVVPRDLVLGWEPELGRADDDEAGIEAHVMVARGDDGRWPAGVHAHAVHPAGARGYRTGVAGQWATVALVWRLRGRVDLLHFFFQPHPRASRVARWLARASGLPAVHTALSAPHERHPAARLVFADRTVALSGHTARRLEVPGRATPDVIGPGLADPRPADPARIRAALAETGLAPGFVIYPGDYEFSGGHELLIDAWARDPALPPLVFAGRDKTAGAAGARAALERRAAAAGLADRVHWLGTVRDLPALLAAAAALLFPARSLYAKTDVPLVVLEAWRESVPVLVSDLPPLAELTDGVGGALPPDPGRWAAAVRGLAAGGAALGAAGRRRLLERHTARACARRYLDLYREVRERRTATAGTR